LALTPQFLLAQAVRYRYLAVKARREANAVLGDPIAPRLIELAEKLEGEAVRDEEEARILLAEQDEAPPLGQHDRDAERRAEVAKGHDMLLEANNRKVERRHEMSSAAYYAQRN
jgi:hypothetical protein